jgi:hypothetical protein
MKRWLFEEEPERVDNILEALTAATYYNNKGPANSETEEETKESATSNPELRFMGSWIQDANL